MATASPGTTATATPNPTINPDTATPTPDSTTLPTTPGTSIFNLIAPNTNANSTTHMPLTTVFTPPPPCTDRPYTYLAAESGLTTFYRDVLGPGEGVNSVCYPYSFRYQHRSTLLADYSPGVCPFGYQAASSAQDNGGGAWQSWCCPSGMSYAQSLGCYSTVTTPTVAMLDSKTKISMSEPFIAADWYIQVAWATGQLDQFTPASAPLLRQSATADPTPLANPNDDDGPNAIQVGVPVGVVTVAVIAVACYALWRRKRRRARDAYTMSEEEEGVGSEEKDSSEDGRNRRDDSAQTQGSHGSQISSGDTPMTSITDNNSEGSRATERRQNWSKSARVESWPDSFDESSPVTEPR